MSVSLTYFQLARWLVSPNPLGMTKDAIQFDEDIIMTKLARAVGDLKVSGDPDSPKRNGVLATGVGNRLDAPGLRRALGHMVYLSKSDECIDFVHSLLVPDPAKRPTAEMALNHPYITSLGPSWSGREYFRYIEQDE